MKENRRPCPLLPLVALAAAAAALAIIICAPADPLRAVLDDDELAEIERCTPRCCTAAAAAAPEAAAAAAAAPLLLAATVATAAVAPWWDGDVPTTLPDVKGKDTEGGGSGGSQYFSEVKVYLATYSSLS